MQDIRDATRDYERWLAQHIPLISSHLRRKHANMSQSAFLFLRGTFYRWIQAWRDATKLAPVPCVLTVADLHVENFGTWRDREGRLVWGVNDFDECAYLPYTADLLRLATSALIAADDGHLSLSAKAACNALLSGYADSIHRDGAPLVLGEENKWLRQMAQNSLRNPITFWNKLDSLPNIREVPPVVRKALANMMPERRIPVAYALRIAGNGSLGRRRYVAIGEWRGGRIAREAKALAPSAACWAGVVSKATIQYQRLLDTAVRCPDPFVRMESNWILRRLSPDCSRIELADLPRERDEDELLYAMGWETANVHLGTPRARTAVSADLRKRNRHWLVDAAQEWAKWVKKDWKAWRDH